MIVRTWLYSSHTVSGVAYSLLHAPCLPVWPRSCNVGQAEPFEAVCCDLAGCMLDRLKGKIDVLLFNPPYVPTPPEEVGSK